MVRTKGTGRTRAKGFSFVVAEGADFEVALRGAFAAAEEWVRNGAGAA